MTEVRRKSVDAYWRYCRNITDSHTDGRMSKNTMPLAPPYGNGGIKNMSITGAGKIKNQQDNKF